ncbi:hypothetical protein EJB05_47595 [Eragrostis curvula]|uniref:Uncharacterized protein n=1 Tax=Eragrostis curvula TaxID=38414 RepID=A0A5J9SZQ0_9POAL|nr:hypothetical protein EJB05_47595 [Eragrostis curvula]
MLASLHSDLPCPPPPFLIRLLHALLPVFLPDRPFSACFRVRQRASRRSPFRILLSRAHPRITIYDNEASFTGQPSGTDGVLIGVTGLEL